MMMIVVFGRPAVVGLACLWRVELRGLVEQTRCILRGELARRGLWLTDSPLSRKPEKEVSDD